LIDEMDIGGDSRVSAAPVAESGVAEDGVGPNSCGILSSSPRREESADASGAVDSSSTGRDQKKSFVSMITNDSFYPGVATLIKVQLLESVWSALCQL
jgi:hypothetical protein